MDANPGRLSLAAVSGGIDSRRIPKPVRVCINKAEGLPAADRYLTEALRVAKQAVGNFLEKNEEVIAMGTYMIQCVQSLLWQALQRELDHELADTG